MTNKTDSIPSKTMTPYQREVHVRWLTIMLEHYSDEEVSLRKRLDAREVWGDGHENEWRRYQAEAAALRAAIEALQLPTPETKERNIEDAARSSEYWKGEHLAANRENERLRALLGEKRNWCDDPLPGRPYPEYACGKCWSCRTRAELVPRSEPETCEHGTPLSKLCEDCKTYLQSPEGKAELASFADAPETCDVAALRDALGMIYDKWEEGTSCYEDPEDCAGYLGNAFKLTQEEEAQILALLPPGPALKARARPCGDGCPGCDYCRSPSDSPPENGGAE